MAEAQAVFKPVGQKFWDITPLFELKPPKPAKPIKCPLCGDVTFYFKHARLFQRHGENPNLPEWLREQFRIDIAIKCDCCGYVPLCGVHINRLTFYDLKLIFIRNGINNLTLEYKHIGHWLVSPVYKKL